MPILTFTLKGDELKHHTVNLHKPLNLRYFKLLHVSTNVTSANLNVKSFTTSGGIVDPNVAEQAMMFLKLSFLTSTDVSFYERSDDGSQYVHTVFSIGDTALGDRKIDSKDLFKTLSTRPIQVHQPFTLEMYAFDTSVKTTSTSGSPLVHAIATAENRLRLLEDMNPAVLPKDVFLTLTFEYDEYDTAPRMN